MFEKLTFTPSPLQIVSDGLSKKGKKLEVSENLLQEITDKVKAENQKRLQMEEDKGQLTEAIEQLDSQKARVKEEIKGPYMQKESAIESLLNQAKFTVAILNAWPKMQTNGMPQPI